jgi:hypothetical protein
LELIESGRLLNYPNVIIKGLMGMASFSEDQALLSKEFMELNELFQKSNVILNSSDFDTLSMGMSSDYELAIEKGSTMVRIGSLLFGARNYTKS